MTIYTSCLLVRTNSITAHCLCQKCAHPHPDASSEQVHRAITQITIVDLKYNVRRYGCSTHVFDLNSILNQNARLPSSKLERRRSAVCE